MRWRCASTRCWGDALVSRLLHISVSARGGGSFSRRVAGQLIAAFQAADPVLRVVERDLAAEPIPHIDAAFAAASLMPEAERTETCRAALAFSEALIAELVAADRLLISTPMHNFTVPSALKAWLDHVMCPGRTFRGTTAGKIGLLANRPTFVIIACGGRFDDDASAQTDFLSPYLRYALTTMGLIDVDIIRLGELNRGPAKVEEAFRQAETWIAERSSSAISIDE